MAFATAFSYFGSIALPGILTGSSYVYYHDGSSDKAIWYQYRSRPVAVSKYLPTYILCCEKLRDGTLLKSKIWKGGT